MNHRVYTLIVGYINISLWYGINVLILLLPLLLFVDVTTYYCISLSSVVIGLLYHYYQYIKRKVINDE